MIRLLLLAALVITMPAFAAAPAATAETPEALGARLLASMRDATGGGEWDKIKLLRVTAKQQIGDETNDEDLWLDPNGGRLAIAIADGPLAGRSGYDGKNAWTADPDGRVQVATAQARSDLLDEFWWRDFLWGRADHGRATSVWLDQPARGSRPADGIRVSVPGGSTIEIWLDRTSHLPLRIVEHRAEGEREIHLSEWRKTEGVSLPRHVEIEFAGQHVVEEATVVEVNGRIDPATFSPPTAPIADYVFPAETASVEVPMKVLNGHVFITAKIAKTRFAVMFDTSSIAVLDTAAATRLNLTPRADGTLRLPDLSVGGIQFKHQTVAVRDLTGLAAAEGVPIDAILGAGLGNRLVLELDYDGRRMVLVKPESFVPPPTATALPLGFAGRIPTVAGRVDGIPVTLAIDTGAGAALTVGPDFVQSRGLAQRWHIVPQILGWQAGAAIGGGIARAASLEIGVLGIAQPLVALPAQPLGLPGVDALLGGGALRRFDVILDYRQGKLWLQPNRSANTPDSTENAGIWLNRDGDNLVVASLLPDSPAKKAGLAVGDVVESVGGDKAITLGLPDVRIRFKGPPGSAVNLGVRRNGDYRNVRVLLADPFAGPVTNSN